VNDLVRLFAPKSLAIIGASRREGSIGKKFLHAVLKMKYTGKIYLVNPKADEIENIKCYPEIENMPVIPDLAVILLPKEFVYQSVQLLAQKGAKHIIIISAGFKEIGVNGQKHEKALLDLVHENGMHMIGPNSMGLFNTDSNISLNATFSPTTPRSGHIAFISQSGALGVGVLELSKKIGLGFSVFVSTGNKADIGDVDVLKYLEHDTNTKVIMLYQESLDNPLDFREICSRLAPQKPILTLKAGRTDSGSRAASSHTGALASDDLVTNAFLKQSGVIRCHTVQEILDTALAFAFQPTPKGNNVAVITNAGGPGIIASDALEQEGLNMTSLSDTTIAQLKEILPAEASVNNPVDMIASATHETYAQVCSLVENDENVDAIFVIIVKPPVDTTPMKIITSLSSVIQDSEKPFFFTLMADIDDDKSMDRFKNLEIPIYKFPEAAAKALGNMIRYVENKRILIKDTKNIETIKISANRAQRGEITQVSFKEIKQILEKYALKMSPFVVVDNLEEALSFHKRMGVVALKIANEELIHKSDLGMVKLNLSSIEAVQQAFKDIITLSSKHLNSKIKPQILVQQMVSKGTELVLGAKKDLQYGHNVWNRGSVCRTLQGCCFSCTTHWTSRSQTND
jgi:acetyltransferase